MSQPTLNVILQLFLLLLNNLNFFLFLPFFAFPKAELGAPAGLAYDISFNKFGMRICFLGLSQNVGSYARRVCRRIVRYQTKLLEGSEKIPQGAVDAAVRSADRARYLSSNRRRMIERIIRESTATDAALEAISFFKSCSGGVCFSQGDVLPRETVNILADLKNIFRSVTGSNVRPSPAIPEVDDIMYRVNWIPRSASSCSIAGSTLISDACGRVPR